MNRPRLSGRLRFLLGLLAACLLTGTTAGHAQGLWSEYAMVSATLGVHDGRICVGEANRGDLGCPLHAPQVLASGLLSATDISATGTIQAGQFVGDGSGLTGVTAAATDRIVSGTTTMIVVSSTGFISLTQGATNTGWFDPQRGLVTLGVSSTGPISATNAYLSGKLGIGTTNPRSPLEVVGGIRIANASWGNPTGHNVVLTASSSGGLVVGGNLIEGTGNLTIRSGLSSIYYHTIGDVQIFQGAYTTNQNRSIFKFQTNGGLFGSIPGRMSKILEIAPGALSSEASTGLYGLDISLTDISEDVNNDVVGINVNVGNGTNNSALRSAAIFRGGNVGIGTVAPTASLDVSGTVSTTLLKLAADPVASCTNDSLGTVKIANGRVFVCRP